MSALADGFVKRTLQLEGITSLRIAVERAKTVKMFQGNSFSEGNKNGRFFSKNRGMDVKAKDNAEKQKEKEGVKEEGKKFSRNKPKECWFCGKQGHYRNECPNNKENAD